MFSGNAGRGNIRPPARLTRPTVVVEAGESQAKLLLLGDVAALTKALPTGLGLPVRPNTAIRTRLGVCLWLRPDQRLLLLSPADGERETVARVRALHARDAWALDVGARYVQFNLRGQDAGTVLNAACSLDLREAAFPPERCAQTRFAEIPVLLFRSTPQCFEILAERPLSSHLWLWLCHAADNV